MASHDPRNGDVLIQGLPTKCIPVETNPDLLELRIRGVAEASETI
jgi:hypothetical protein